GPSGCGKTTLLRLIAGFEKPLGGRVVIDNVEVSSPSAMMPPHRRKLSMVFQDLALWPHMTVAQHLEFVFKKEGRTKQGVREGIGGILQNVRIEHLRDRYPHQLSGGEKQRLAIGRALASFPSYLLMDEPFSHLDPRLKEELQQQLLTLNHQSNMGILYVTHNMEEAHAGAGRLAFMDTGVLVRMDDTRDLLERYSTERAEGFEPIK
ncbi:MAG TPA: ABC transporter ATP-binding protein, partial [Syntrophobacteraceae bacterium]|nr:ABC transporter ATP-binding protein [Syntrophobacteraceae bacterium]